MREGRRDIRGSEHETHHKAGDAGYIGGRGVLDSRCGHCPGRYGLSTIVVLGRSLPLAVSSCHRPFSSSYWMTSDRPGTFCSAAARLAAAIACAWVVKGSENTAPTL